MTRSWVFALAVLASCGNDSLSPAQRQEVRALIAEDRAEQARLSEQSRVRMLENQVAAAVDRAAQEHHLSPEQKGRLLEVVRLNEQKVGEIGERLTNATQNGNRAVMEGIFRDVEDWRLAELTTRFGEDVGKRLNGDPLWITVLGRSLPH